MIVYVDNFEYHCNMETTRTEISVIKSLKIIKKAIKHDLSLSEASRQHNMGRNYVSDVKLRLENNFNRYNVTPENYTAFNKLIKRVDAIKRTERKLARLKKI